MCQPTPLMRISGTFWQIFTPLKKIAPLAPKHCPRHGPPTHMMRPPPWAGALVRLDEPAQAERVLNDIDSAKVHHEADYPFCLGVVAEWKHQPRKALRYYAQAIDLCRYRPEYFLHYGRLLKAQGDSDAAQKALIWAARIDAGDVIRKQVQYVLKQ